MSRVAWKCDSRLCSTEQREEGEVEVGQMKMKLEE